jgi:hypothetical protein
MNTMDKAVNEAIEQAIMQRAKEKENEIRARAQESDSHRMEYRASSPYLAELKGEAKALCEKHSAS